MQFASTSCPRHRSAAVLIQFSAGGCSGAFVYVDAVLTAGHCVHAGNGGAWASNVRVSPGADGAARPYGTVSTIDYMTTYVGWARQAAGTWRGPCSGCRVCASR